ncbi:latrophilin Cirl-like [Arctopsyche grandis]|uniref:latrophilin Cirl-like n=1 Tax=Arctopsyche grandis TaxID=121162 RepID=UPI00406D9F9B
MCTQKRYSNWAEHPSWHMAEAQYSRLTPCKEGMEVEEGEWQRPRLRARRPTPTTEPPGSTPDGGPSPGTPPCDPCRVPPANLHHRCCCAVPERVSVSSPSSDKRDGQCCDKCYDSLRPVGFGCGGGRSRGGRQDPSSEPGCRPRSVPSTISLGQTIDSLLSLVWSQHRDTPTYTKSKRRHSSTSSLMSLLVLFAVISIVQARSAELPRYETAYACEGKTLKIECKDGEVIQLIRANYGRFSITICNDHGNTEWSVNCMSNKSLRVLHTRCTQSQNCSILASTNVFGDPCPKTLKYLEAHYKCAAATTTSSTFRPSPPWLITSQPSVWRSTVPTSLGAGAGVGGSVTSNSNTAEKPRPPPGVHHLAPPTFRPHITMPPDLRPGVVKVKNDGHSPEVVEKSPKLPTEVANPVVPGENAGNVDQSFEETEKSVIDSERPRLKNKEENSKDGFTENPIKKDADGLKVTGNDKNIENSPPSPHDRDSENVGSNERDNKRHHKHHHVDTTDQPIWRYCQPQSARGLHWNWTIVAEVAVQPCPGGATGLARWRCVSSAHRLSHLQQQRRLGSPSRDGGIVSQSRTPVILDALGAETLLNGRDIENNDPKDYQENLENLMLPDPLAFNNDLGIIGIQNQNSYEGQPVWISENPDLSECRSVWLNSLEMRVKEGESLLSISNDLSQVTSSKTLYGGDMMTTTNIMKRLAQKMSMSIQSFPDTRQREAIVTDLLLGVVKTGSNLLDISQQASWKDLSHPAQMQVATSLLIGLEENAFLLAGAVLREKTIVQQSKNILLSVRVLETKNVETEEFPTALAREKWVASQDIIYLPRGALIDNSEGGLVRIVFVAFDRLEEILQPPPAPVIPAIIQHPMDESMISENLHIRHQQMNSEKDRDNITRVINSKVISASLGKGRHIQLSQPVRLTLRHLQTENVTNPTCVFWDFTVNVWSAEGCRVEWSNTTHTGCQCTHLTNFALLMDVHSVPLSAANALALNIITLVGCGISVVALFASIIVFQCVGGMKSDRVTIHKNLCACLLIAELIFMFGIEWTTHRVVCGIIAVLLHYFFLAAFAWMFLEGFQLYAMLVEVFEPERARACWYYMFAYLVPLVIVGISGLVDAKSYGTPHHCWLRSDNYFHLAFIGPAALVLVANWLILCLVIYMMCRHSHVSIKAKENNKLYKIRVWLRSSVVLVFILGLTWTFGLLYLNQETVVMAFIFTIFNSLQGLFIFVFHCLQNEMFQKECGRLGRRYKWLSCCLWLAPNLPSGPTPATGSSTAPGSVPQCPQAAVSATSAKHTRQHRHHSEDQGLEDVSDRDHPTGHSSAVSASTTNNLVINNLNVVVNNNNHNNNHVINNAAVASLAAAAAAHSYHQHRNRRNSSQYNNNSPNAGNSSESSRECNQPNNHTPFYGANLNSQDNSNQINSNMGTPNTSAPMSHLRNPLNIGHPTGQRLPPGYRHNLQQGNSITQFS